MVRIKEILTEDNPNLSSNPTIYNSFCGNYWLIITYDAEEKIVSILTNYSYFKGVAISYFIKTDQFAWMFYEDDEYFVNTSTNELDITDWILSK